MDKFWAHLFPGLYFSLLGLWWMFNVACNIAILWKSNAIYRAFSWFPTHRFPTIEPWCSLGLCALFAFIEFVSGSGEDDSTGFGAEHIGMYSVIAFLNIIQLLQFYRNQKPSPYEYLLAMFVYSVVGVELYSHLKESPIVDATLHSQLASLIVPMVIVNLLEFFIRHNPIVGMVRAAVMFLLGLNFIHTAFLLYPLFGYELLDANSVSAEKKVIVIFIFEMISVALPSSVIMIGVVVDFYDNYL